MESLVGLLILVADIFAIVKILQSSAETLKKLLWIVIIILLPVAGVVIWYLIGPGGKSG